MRNKTRKKSWNIKKKVDKFIEDRKQSKIKPYEIEPNGNLITNKLISITSMSLIMFFRIIKQTN